MWHAVPVPSFFFFFSSGLIILGSVASLLKLTKGGFYMVSKINRCLVFVF